MSDIYHRVVSIQIRLKIASAPSNSSWNGSPRLNWEGPILIRIGICWFHEPCSELDQKNLIMIWSGIEVIWECYSPYNEPFFGRPKWAFICFYEIIHCWNIVPHPFLTLPHRTSTKELRWSNDVRCTSGVDSFYWKKPLSVFKSW